MCNLYRLGKPAEDVAHLFAAIVGNAGMGEVYPGKPGLVVARQTGVRGPRELRSMTWGFPLMLGAKQNRRSRDNGRTASP